MDSLLKGFRRGEEETAIVSVDILEAGDLRKPLMKAEIVITNTLQGIFVKERVNYSLLLQLQFIVTIKLQLQIQFIVTVTFIVTITITVTVYFYSYSLLVQI